jgi:hypothetical protein
LALVSGTGLGPWGGAREDSVGRNRIARSQELSGQDSIGRVAADVREVSADYAGHPWSCGRSNELVTIRPEAWAATWRKSVNEIIE